MATHYDVLPIPARLPYTRLFSAGPIQIGVEYRLLNEDIISEEYGEDSREQFGNAPPPELPAVVDEDGVSVHIFDETASREYVRFDCFEDYPHYHYIDAAAGHQTVHGFDVVAHGPMDEWVVQCLSRRLPEMLTEAGAADLARALDPTTLGSVLEDVALEIERARQCGRPTLAEASAASCSPDGVQSRCVATRRKRRDPLRIVAANDPTGRRRENPRRGSGELAQPRPHLCRAAL
jgi:hypothetical protein